MATLVINRNSISLNLESDHLVIHRHVIDGDEPERETLPVKDINRVLIVGRPAISFSVLVRLMDRGIPCCFMTRGGRWRGILKSGLSHNGARRRLQYERLQDEAFCLKLARELVRSKIRNSRRCLQRLYANRQMRVPHNDCWNDLEDSLNAVATVRDLDALRGVEGMASFCYFRLLGDFFPDDFLFVTRSRRPPLDPANALLSFAYTALMNECLAAVELHGLDSAVGFMHQDSCHSPALALDLMESFRSPYADLLVLNLLNHRRFSAEDFETDMETGGVYLTQSGRAKFYPASEQVLERKFVPLGESVHVDLRGAIDRQVVVFIKALEEDRDPVFFRMA